MKERWWKKSYMKLRSTHPDKNLVVLSPEFMAWATNLYGQLKTRFHKHGLGRYEGEKPMSGYYAILWALQVRHRPVHTHTHTHTPSKKTHANQSRPRLHCRVVLKRTEPAHLAHVDPALRIGWGVVWRQGV